MENNKNGFAEFDRPLVAFEPTWIKKGDISPVMNGDKIFYSTFPEKDLELYQHAFIGFNATIEIEYPLLPKEFWKHSLWIVPEQIDMFRDRLHAMRKAKEAGEEYWMLPDLGQYPTAIK